MAQHSELPSYGPRTAAKSLNISTSKAVLFVCIIVFGFLACLELTVRVGGYLLYDRSPYFLFYGFKSVMASDGDEGHSAAFDGYFKFPPSRTLHQYGMFQKPTPIRINSLGFRGRDFAPEKQSDVFRVACLGESSTFGYFDRDDFTYPALLEQIFAEQKGWSNPNWKRIEVINAGIPHANSDNLLAILKGEVLGYKPNLITVYAAYNDAQEVMDETQLQQLLRWLHGHYATYVAMKRIVAMLGGPELHSRWAKYSSGTNRTSIDHQIQLHVERYQKNIESILLLARQHGITIVLVKQPVDVINNQKRYRRTGLTYEEEATSTRQKLAAGEWLSGGEVTLLVHNELIRTLEKLANGSGAILVDNIAIADRHPEYYASYVHLTEEGNGALADALYRAILPIVESRGGVSQGGA